jgi:hypothetical protein
LRHIYYIIFQVSLSISTSSFDTKESLDKNSESLKSRDHHLKFLIDLFHTQTKKIVGAVLALTRQSESDYDSRISSSTYNRLLSPLNDKELMQLVRNIAIAVRDLLQTLDYAPISIKEMVKKYFLKANFLFDFLV